jgi:hypothetical protein
MNRYEYYILYLIKKYKSNADFIIFKNEENDFELWQLICSLITTNIETLKNASYIYE